MGERDYQRRRDPGLFAGVAAGFRSLFPGAVARDATGRMKPSQPRGGVTFRSVLDELGIGSLDAAARAGRRKATAGAAATIAGGGGDDTLGSQDENDVIFDESKDSGTRDGAAPPQDPADIVEESEDWQFATPPFGSGQRIFKSTGPIMVVRQSTTLGIDGGVFTVDWHPLDENGKRMAVVQPSDYKASAYGGHIGPLETEPVVINPPWDHKHGFEVTVSVPPQAPVHGNTAGINYQVLRSR